MTKEELEKEAETKYKTGSYPQLHPEYFAFIHGYLAGAEPREKRIEELENKIADIKAKYDLAIEGRDVKIMELEKENERLKGDLELWESGGCRATNLFKCGVVKELKEQIEKMKCCFNCSKDCGSIDRRICFENKMKYWVMKGAEND